MDSSVLLAGIGVAGTLLGALSGAIVGAWVNPRMQDWYEKQKLEKFIKNCKKEEKFIILSAYRMVFLPIANVKINNFNEFSKEDIIILNNLITFCKCLGLIIQKFKEERKIFATFEYESGYTIALYSNISNFINSNKQIKDNLIKETKEFIATEIYPHYKLMLKDTIFSKIDNKLIGQYVTFLNNIGVFDIYNKDLNHLNPENPKSYLEFPKGIFHPESN